MRALRLIRRLLVLLGVLVLLVLAGGGGLLWLTLPPTHQETRIAGLSGPIDISLDQDGVPRIHARSMTDAYTALGFLHARDRLFQMELMRRTVAGRLAEIAGPAGLPTDRLMRVLGLRRRAVADIETLPAETRAALDAYARGVNAWIALRGRFAAPEFLLIGTPEPWTPADTLGWGKFMAYWLTGNWRVELSRLGLEDKLPPARILELWPPTPMTPAPDATAWLPRFAGLRRLDALLPRFPDRFTQPDEASDEWAVDGRYTASGAPLLAGDPHLDLGFPGLWYLARIDTPEGVLAGATAPGVPFQAFGHNGHIAWTFTTTGADTADVFEETPLPGGRYQTPDGPAPFIVREERIAVRGGKDEVLTVRETRHGPVISDLLPDPHARVLAVAMAALQPGDAAPGLLALNRATSVAEAELAAPLIVAPVQNLLVADRARIGFFTTGRVPLRRWGDGSVPVPGADGQHDWTGFAEGDALPFIIAPGSGRLVNGNERTAPPDFPVFLGRDWPADWRARRIRADLGRSNRLKAEDFAAMQADDVSVFARQILPTLLAVPGLDGLPAQAQTLLRSWDGAMDTNLPQPLILNAWTQRFARDLLETAGAPESATGPWPDLVAWVLTPEGAHWCGGDCTPKLRQALGEALADLSARFGQDPATWRWGDAHRAVFAHALLQRVPLIGRLATSEIAAPGDETTLFRAGNGRLGNFTAAHGAAYRGVYDLADLDHSLFMIVPGQSGNPLRAHAWDLMQRWAKGTTLMLAPVPAEIRETIRIGP
ncbi:MAG TPA: penicillin acylase family protein [Acetobacteraceae bacterium]|nr:penicillin acylase family protein [Acetobacteraceae bacterium]